MDEMGYDGHFVWQQFSRPNVRFGSKADIAECLRHVRFTPESGHRRPSLGPLGHSFHRRSTPAMIGHLPTFFADGKEKCVLRVVSTASGGNRHDQAEC